jgi:hypothetical protein
MIRRGLRVNEAALRLRPHAVKDTKMTVIYILKKDGKNEVKVPKICAARSRKQNLKRRRDKA